MTLPFSSIVPGKPRSVQSGLLFSFDTEDGYPQVRTGQTLTYATAAASRGTCVDATGRVKLQTQSQPRLHHEYDATTGLWLPAGLVLEGTRTNSWLWSRDLSNVAWVKTNVTISTDTTKGPDSDFTTASKMQETATATVEHLVSQTLPALTAATKQCVSFTAKYSRPWCFVKTVNKANVTRRSWVDLSTGAVGTKDSGHQITVHKLADGWWRIYCQWDSGTGATTPTAAVGIATADNTFSYTGAVGSGIYVTDLQFETDQAVPSAIIPTTSTTASRQTDTCSSTFDWGLGDLTVYVKLPRPLWLDWTTNLVNSKIVFKLSSGNPRLWLFFYPLGSQIQYLQLTDAVPNYSQWAPFVPSGTPLEYCCQVRNLSTGGSVQLDTGSGFGGWSAPTINPITAWGDNVVRFDDGTAGSLLGSLQVVRIAAGLRTMAQMRGYR